MDKSTEILYKKRPHVVIVGAGASHAVMGEKGSSDKLMGI